MLYYNYILHSVQTYPLGNNYCCCEYCVSPGQKLHKDFEVEELINMIKNEVDDL